MKNDSTAYVQPILASKFERKETTLNTDQILEFLSQKIRDIAGEGTKIVSLIGGAASGKTTMAQILVEELQKRGITADRLNTDDFNRGNRAWRWENFEGENPKNPLDKYDFGLLNQKVEAIKQNTDPNTTIPVPTYNQATGLAIDEGEENYKHRIGPINVLIVEGDFHPVSHPDLVIFMHMPDEKRLQSRIDRDVVHRSADKDKTIASFNLRQERQHFPHTLPTINKADIVLDIKTDGENRLYDVYQAKQ